MFGFGNLLAFTPAGVPWRVCSGDILRQRLEPDGRPAGDGPRSPARPDQAGHRLQAHLQGHHRGAHPAARQGEERGA